MRCRKPLRIPELKADEIDHQLKIAEEAPTVRAAIAMMIFAGLRRAEAIWIPPGHVDLKQKIIHIREHGDWAPKTGRGRMVPIVPRAEKRF